ncbi:hypothetical protein N7528_006793 [Penicillium herquei]|nr:hypothetical protein N7528_006793 [Penicillium herquei]
MKRKLTAANETSAKRQPRQVPVSCESCRKKKLKCDRTLPCSNCSARRISCSFGDYGPAGGSNMLARPAAQTEPTPPAPERPESARQATVEYREVSQEKGAKDEPFNTANRLENILMAHRVPSAVPSTVRRHLSQPRLGSSVSRQGSTTGSLSSLIHGGSPATEQNPIYVPIISYLPPECEMMELFDFYDTYLDYQYHLVILHQTKRDIHDLYTAIARNEPLDYGVLALSFSIASVALLFQLLSTRSTEYAEEKSGEAAFLTGAALIQGNYMTYPSIAGLQACLIIAHHTSGLALDPSVGSLFMQGAIITQAKSLRLHLLDSPRSIEEREVNGYNKTELELKRRIWWDLATYDWLLSFLSGPQEYSYSISPAHMNVNLPLNIEDEDIETGSERPLSTPTIMSYTIGRLRLSEVCREIVDKTASKYFQGGEMPYETILELDKKLNEAYATVPDYFRFEPSMRRKYANLYREQPKLAWQSAFVQQGYQARFCRLHRWHFIRGAKDPRYSYSHIVSMQSARKVLELKRIMDEEGMAPHGSFFWAVMHHVFMAAVTLLINVCFNCDDILAERQKEEVLDACRMLSRAQAVSSIAREGINEMMGTLRKYWKHEKRAGCGEKQSAPQYRVEAQQPTPVSGTSQQSGGQFSHSAQYSLTSEDMPFDTGNDCSVVPLEDLWSEMLDDSAHVGIDTPGLMEMLTELSATTLPC